MGILDKLRPQARWKHGYSAVPLEAVHGLDDSAADVFTQVATDDHDARVRRAAVARLSDPDTLAAVSRNDADTGVRDGAVERLAALAAAAHDGAVRAVAALGGLGRHRELATLARSSAPETARHAAVSLLGDAKALGGVARHALDAGTRLLALERLSDAAELEAVATNGEHADAAVAALDRLVSPTSDQLSAIAQRARTKAAAKRAKALLAAATAPAPGRPHRPLSTTRTRIRTPPAPWSSKWRRCRRRRRLGHPRRVCRRARGLGRAARRRRGAARYHRRVRDAVGPWTRTAVAADEGRRAEESRAGRGAAPRSRRSGCALCERVEALAGDAAARRARGGPRRVGRAAADGRDVGHRRAAPFRRRGPGGRAPARASGRGPASWRRKRRRWSRRPKELVRRPGRRRARPRQALRRKWQAIGRGGRGGGGARRALRRGQRPRSTRASRTSRAARQRSQEDNLHRLQSAVQALETRAAAETLSLKDADTLIKDVKLAVGTMGPLPTPQDREDLDCAPAGSARGGAAAARGTTQRRRVEALGQRPGAGRPVHEDGSAHRRGGSRAREGRQRDAGAAGEVEAGRRRAALPGRNAVDALQGRAVAGLRQVQGLLRPANCERQEALKKKVALCERAEALAESTDWDAPPRP